MFFLMFFIGNCVNRVFSCHTRQQPAVREARRRTSMSVIDSSQIPDRPDPRFEIGQMSHFGPFLEPQNMTLRNSIHGKRVQKWTKNGPDGRTLGSDGLGG